MLVQSPAVCIVWIFFGFFLEIYKQNPKTFQIHVFQPTKTHELGKKLDFFLKFPSISIQFWKYPRNFQDILKIYWHILEISKKNPRFLYAWTFPWKFPKKKTNCAYCRCPIFSIICLRQPNFLRTAYLLFNMNIAIAYCYCLFLLLSVIAIASCLGFRYCLLLLPTVKHEYCYCLLPIAIAQLLPVTIAYC